MRERVFEKDGDVRTTSTPSAAVEFLARGYREVLDEPGYVGGTPKPDLSRVQPRRPATDLPGRAPSDERNHAPD